MMRIANLILAATILSLPACTQTTPQERIPGSQSIIEDMDKKGLAVATLGAGCFWCVEAVFQELKGVYKVESGYSGGKASEATYRQVCSGNTRHAEVVQVHFDPEEVGFETILDVFWATHDPTTLNRQGNDRGPQYRSVIFYHDDDQRRIAELSRSEVAPRIWDDPIVTEISPFEAFYPAEGYHQNYYSQNTDTPYCRAIITPKVIKFRKTFADKLRDGE